MSIKNMDDFVKEAILKAGPPKSVTFIEEPEPEPLFCPIISADDHALEPANLFEGRVPKHFADRAPHIRTDDGIEWWVLEDTLVPQMLVNGAVGRTVSEWGVVPCRFDQMRRAAWDPKARLQDMDNAGVWGSLCFGSSTWGFAGTRFSKMKDLELGYACLQAYNDWMIEEWVGTAPDRFISCQLPWLADAELAAAEIRRNAARGFRSVSFSENPEGLGFPNVYTDFWDPFFAACEETGTVVNLHVGSSGQSRKPCSDSAMATTVALFPESGIEALIDWIFARIPVRFPGLTIVLSEAGISWVPMAIERLARAHRQRNSNMNDWTDDLPTPMELVERNFYFTSIEDPSGFQMLDRIGEDQVMVETDYPHYDSTWPGCQSMIRYQLTGLDPAVIRKVCFENAARVYRQPLPPAELIARADFGMSLRPRKQCLALARHREDGARRAPV